MLVLTSRRSLPISDMPGIASPRRKSASRRTSPTLAPTRIALMMNVAMTIAELPRRR